MRLLVLAPPLLIAVCHGFLSGETGPPPSRIVRLPRGRYERRMRSSGGRTRKSRVVAAFLPLPVPHHPHPHVSLGSAPKQARGRCRDAGNVPSSRIVVRLTEKSTKNSDQKPQQQPYEWLEFLDTGLLFADVMAVAIACQFMGLMDVLADVDFWKNGGWLQPIDYSGLSTLPVLVQRFSFNTVLWVVASLCLGGYNADSSTVLTAIRTTTKPTTPQGNILVSALQRSGVYSLLRIVTEAGFSLLLLGESSENNNPAAFLHHWTLYKCCANAI